MCEPRLLQPDLATGPGTTGEISTGATFLAPMSVLVHRVDIAAAVPVSELASCR